MNEVAQTNITRGLAEFSISLKFDGLPPEVIAEAKNGILDTLGVALAGSSAESTRMIRDTLGGADNSGNATMLGMKGCTSPAMAAMVNACAAHALDYDDTQHHCNSHMSAPVLPAVLAAAEACRSSGKALLTAYVTGFEVGCKLARVGRFGRHLLQRGVHSTPFLGRFGAIAGIGSLMELDVPQMARGFGIAASQAAGVMRSFGTMCKPLEVGAAARDAIVSALLAKQKFSGPEAIFDGEHSIFAMHGTKTDPEALVGGLGRDFEIMDNTLKVYACAGWRNPIIEALIYLAETHELKASDVAKIRIWACTDVMHLPNYPEPASGLEAKFSAQYAAAVALTDRLGGVPQFSDVRVADPALADLTRRVSLHADEMLGPYQIRVQVDTVNGRNLVHFIPAQKGDPRNPLSWADLASKFHCNAEGILPDGQAQRLVDLLRDLEAVDDISELTSLFRPG